MSEILAPTDRQEMLIAEIRAMAVAAAEEADAEKAIAMLSAVGTIASSLRDYWALQNAEFPVVPVAEAVPAPQLAVVGHIEPVPVEAPVAAEPEPKSEPAKPVAVVSEVNGDAQAQEPEADKEDAFDITPFESLRLTSRQQEVLAFIDGLRGQKFKRSDVVSQFKGEVGKAVAERVFTEVVSMLRSRRPFSEALEREGVRGGVTYVWRGLETTAPESDPDQPDDAEQNEEEPATPAKQGVTVVEHGETLFKVAQTLEKVGITIDPQARDRLHVRGVPMRLTELSVLVVLVLAEFDCKADYKTMILHPKMQQLMRSNKNLNNELHVALGQIEREMKRFDIPWAAVPTMRDGKKVMRLRLGEDAVTRRA
ncbi:MAG TPA: hypothetical protein VGE30_01210 [Candidatus Saccharimonadales bacterium]